MTARSMLIAAAISAGCAHAQRESIDHFDPALWQAARGRLDALRRRHAPAAPYRMRLALAIEHEALGGGLRGRGAVAVAAPHALRMVLLGPGGTTAMDLWVCGSVFRFALPALGREVRGDLVRRAPDAGLPVPMLRWWLLAPLSGSMQWTRKGERGIEWLLRDGTSFIHVREEERELRLSRLDRDVLVVDGRPCGAAEYRDEHGLHVRVRCEERLDAPPPAGAFDDPETGELCPHVCAGEEKCKAPEP